MMKVSSLFALFAATTLGASVAFGFAEVARGELISATTARLVYDSRVFGGLNAADDYIFTLDPRLLYRREAGQLKLDSFVGVRINRYDNFSNLDSNDLESSIKLSLPAEGATLASGRFETNYDERTIVNYDINREVREKDFNATLDSVIPTGLKTSFLLGGTLRRDQRIHFGDRDSRDGNVGFRYQNFAGGTTVDFKYRRFQVKTTAEDGGIPIDQKSDIYTVTVTRPLYHDVRAGLTYGYRILNRSQAETPDGMTRSAGSIVGLDLNGPFLPQSLFPKVESSLSLGYQKTETPGINDKGGTRLYGAMNISWHARERTRLFVNARRATELSINNLTVETTGANVGIQESVGNFTSLTASGGYEQRDYRTLGRSDDIYVFNVGAHYKITAKWSASADYNLRSAASSETAANYARSIVSLAVTYSF
jgi:hypothetical protein